MADEQADLIEQVVLATTRHNKAVDALEAAETEAEAARVAQSKAWTALRRYQAELVASRMAESAAAPELITGKSRNYPAVDNRRPSANHWADS